MSDPYPDELLAQGEWGDVINRTTEEFAQTVNGAPPPVVIEGILQAQNGQSPMTTGEGQGVGLANLAMTSEDVRMYQQTYGAEPAMWDPETSIRVVTNATNLRQERGGYLADWHAAAFGITGAVDETGINQTMPEDEMVRARYWGIDYLSYFNSARAATGKDVWAEIDALQPGTLSFGSDDSATGIVVTPPDGGDPQTTPEPQGEGLPDEGLIDAVASGVADRLGITEGVNSIIDAVREWLPRIGLFIAGTALTGIGIWLLVRPAEGEEPEPAAEQTADGTTAKPAAKKAPAKKKKPAPKKKRTTRRRAPARRRNQRRWF